MKKALSARKLRFYEIKPLILVSKRYKKWNTKSKTNISHNKGDSKYEA